MSFEEIAKEAVSDIEKIFSSSTVERLQIQYAKYRNSNNITKGIRYPKCYEIKTKRKNKWIIIIECCGMKNGGYLLETTLFTYFYTNKGLRVVLPARDNKQIFIFNSHVFKRWSERLSKNIIQPLEMAKQYFMGNDECIMEVLKDNYVFGIIKDGFILGEKYDTSIQLIKTFITTDIAFQSQLDKRREILKCVKPGSSLYTAFNEIK